MKLIFLLTGVSGSGKDTVAKYLADKYDFVWLQFASPLRAFVKELYDLDDRHFERPQKDQRLPIGETPRDLLIKHAGRIKLNDPEVFARSVRYKIEKSQSDKFIVSDLRFFEEVSVADSHIRVIININRGIDGKKYDNIKTDIVVDNLGTIKELYDKLDALVGHYMV